MKILDALTEQLKAGSKAMKLSPILLAIKDKLFDLHQDLVAPKPPDAAAQALERVAKEVTFIKDNTFHYHNPRKKITE